MEFQRARRELSTRGDASGPAASAGPSDVSAARQDFERELVALLPRLMAQAMWLTRDRTAAEDLVSAAVVNALAARDRFIPGSNLSAWMQCILRNRFISDVCRRRPTVSLDVQHERGLARGPNQEDRLMLREVAQALRALPDEQRRILMLAAGGASYEAIAAMTGEAIGTIKSRVHRVRRRINCELQHEEHVPGSAESRPRRECGAPTGGRRSRARRPAGAAAERTAPAGAGSP